jgi:hypothetical protein
VATQTYPTIRSIFSRQPKLTKLFISVVYFRLPYPNRGTLRRLGLNARYSEVFGVYPDFAAIEDFLIRPGNNVEDILGVSRRFVETDQGEFVVAGV